MVIWELRAVRSSWGFLSSKDTNRRDSKPSGTRASQTSGERLSDQETPRFPPQRIVVVVFAVSFSHRPLKLHLTATILPWRPSFLLWHAGHHCYCLAAFLTIGKHWFYHELVDCIANKASIFCMIMVLSFCSASPMTFYTSTSPFVF